MLEPLADIGGGPRGRGHLLKPAMVGAPGPCKTHGISRAGKCEGELTRWRKHVAAGVDPLWDALEALVRWGLPRAWCHGGILGLLDWQVWKGRSVGGLELRDAG